MSLLSQVRHGSRVTVVDRHGVEHTLKANGLLIFRGSHCVLSDPRKKHGGNGFIATDANIVRVYTPAARPAAVAVSERSSERAAEASWLEGMAS